MALRRLRSKLILSHVAVIMLVFVLTVLVASVPIRRAQARAEESRLRNVAESIALQTDFVTRPNATRIGEQALRTFIDRQALRTQTRILIADGDGTIRYDSATVASLTGSRLPGLDVRVQILRDLAATTVDQTPGRVVVPVTFAQSAGTIAGRPAVIATTTLSNDRTDAIYPVVVSPQLRVPIFDRYVRPLLFGAMLAIVAGVGTSLWLARSIARPITRLTESAREITAGKLDHRAPGEGDDEVGTLVRAFNNMMARLSSTYASQRVLLANIAHELRTPLTSIQGYAQALRDGIVRDDTERDEALRAIGEESERMGDLVNHVLQLSRLESGQLPLRSEPVDVAALLERLRRSLAPRARDAAVTLSVDSPDDLMIVGDAELLTQALSNLATNALRHTPAGGVVSLRATRVASPGGVGAVRVAVSDTGSGIPAADLPHIFDRFYRGGSETGQSSADSGTGGSARRFGLGLAIAREVVARHGGTLAVESDPGRGTTFTLDLPVERIDSGAVTPERLQEGTVHESR